MMPFPETFDTCWLHPDPDFSSTEPQSDAVHNDPLPSAAGIDSSADFAAPGEEINGLISEMIGGIKQNVKAAVATSGASISISDGQQGPCLSQLNNFNGTAIDKQRSRSGSMIHSSPEDQHRVLVRETPKDKILLEQYVYREFQHSALEAWHNPTQEVLQHKRAERDHYLALRRRYQMNPAALYGVGYEGFGNARTDLPNQHPQLLYPSNRRRPGGRKARELRVSRRDMEAQNEQIEDLVPIRLDIDWDKVKIRDTFTWNLHDYVTSPDLFAERLVEDLGLPLESCVPLVRQISESIQEQLNDYYPQVFIEEDPLDPHLPYTAYKNDEMRILIKLNITIGQHTLIDQFEWEINNPYNSPEEFAIQMTNDLSLLGEFTTAIAHSIREQAQLFTRSLYIISYPFDGRPIEDPDLKAASLPSPLSSPFRPFHVSKEFTPYLYELNDLELERTELSFSREQRRQKRSVNSRGGPVLPDLIDRQRTIRTMITSSLPPNSTSLTEETHLFKRAEERRSAPRPRNGGDDSDISDSEESSRESPAIGSHLAQGTARTRGIRGAASAAQAALRANFAHSATPEPSLLYYETRVPARKVDYREEGVDHPDNLIVKLRISRDKFRQLLKALKNRNNQPPMPIMTGPTGDSQTSQSSTPEIPTATLGSATPPQALPQQSEGSAQSRTSNTNITAPPHASGQKAGAVDAPHPLPPGTSGPSPPAWLLSSLQQLQRLYPSHSFEGVMHYSPVDASTSTPVSNANSSHPGQKLKYQYLPRIRCLDCPRKLYHPGPGTTVNNFKVHLRNRQHKERVEGRLAKAAGTGVSTF